MRVWRDDGVPANVPLFMTEGNIAWNTGESFVNTFGALWLADFAGAFLASGGDRLYYFHYLPVGLYHGCGGSLGTFGMFASNRQFEITQPTSQFFASQMINLEWVQPGAGKHQVFPASANIDDPAGNALVTAYAVKRPDGQWAVMVVNKDQENAYSVKLAFNDSTGKVENSFSGPVDVISFGSEQYHWNPAVGAGDLPNASTGNADPDGPALRSQVVAGMETSFTLPKASVTVLRGKIGAEAKGKH
jgi:hypothetical protein